MSLLCVGDALVSQWWVAMLRWCFGDGIVMLTGWWVLMNIFSFSVGSEAKKVAVRCVFAIGVVCWANYVRVQNCAVSFELFLIVGCKWKQMRSKLKIPRGWRKGFYYPNPINMILNSITNGLSYLHLTPSFVLPWLRQRNPKQNLAEVGFGKTIHASLSIPKTKRNGFPFSTVAHKDGVGYVLCLKLSSDQNQPLVI